MRVPDPDDLALPELGVSPSLAPVLGRQLVTVAGTQQVAGARHVLDHDRRHLATTHQQPTRLVGIRPPRTPCDGVTQARREHEWVGSDRAGRHGLAVIPQYAGLLPLTDAAEMRIGT